MRVLLTGHTGFKGGWLALMLNRLGAEVTGVSLPPPTEPSLSDAVRLQELVDHRIGDIRAPADYARAAEGVDAELVVHMAAQPIVRRSHADPVDTYLTNVVGTSVVLEHARRMPSLRGVIVVTSDKCYDNREWPWAYRETDRLGGTDPYSASKACTELVAQSARRCHFSTPGGPQLVTVRAGNVFGGGDWAEDRLIPDLVRAAAAGTPALIRNPASVRPWQHVLDALSGYVELARRLVQGVEVDENWNFGPDPTRAIDVGTLTRVFCSAWGPGGPTVRLAAQPDGPAEAVLLAVDSSKARAKLGWTPALSVEEALAMTADWYRRFAAGEDMRAVSIAQIEHHAGLRAGFQGADRECA